MLPPRSTDSRAKASRRSRLRATASTLCPGRASSRAKASPIPEEAPVTTVHPLPELSPLIRDIRSRIDFGVTPDFGLAGQDVPFSLILLGEGILYGHFHVAR